METKIQKLKEHIKSIDWILVGTILKQYKQCGNPNCKCMKDKKHRHGPYYVWTRKENGKTITKTLSPEQAKECKKAFLNMKKLNQYIKSWKEKSLKHIDNI